MRWEALFDDLEGQAQAVAAAEFAAEVSERTRAERSVLRLVDRLRSMQGHPLHVTVPGSVLTGVLARVGSDWALLREPAGRQTLVRLPAALGVSGLGVRSASPGSEGRVTARLGFGSALRAVARDRSPVTVVLVDGSHLTGTVDGVGADYVEVAQHAAGEPRRRGAVRGVRAVPFTAVAAVRSG
jgi:hypothetical protein